MGGDGSGRWCGRPRRRAVVEKVRSLRSDQAAKVAMPPDFGPCDGVRLTVSLGGPETYILLAEACRLGGVRWYWSCPYCGHRRMSLYLASGGVWACRECLRLSYRSRQMSRHDDANIRDMMANGAAERGWTPFLLRRLVFDHSGRKRGMRWRLSTALAAYRSGLIDLGASDGPEMELE